MGDEAGRSIYMIREGKIKRFRRYRESNRYSGVNLKYLRIYGRQYNNRFNNYRRDYIIEDVKINYIKI
jgi:hypothetical protein